MHRPTLGLPFSPPAVDDVRVHVAIRGLLWLLAIEIASGCSEDGITLDTVFVDESAAPGGDGSEDRPLTSVGEALTQLPPGGLMYVAPGRYPVPSEWAFPSTVTILGSLQAPTNFLADNGEAITWSGSENHQLTIRDVAFQDGFHARDIDLELRNVVINGLGPALRLTDADASMTQVDIRVTGIADSGDYADDAFLVQDSALDWTSGSAIDAPDRGIVIDGSLVSLTGIELSSGARAAIHQVAGSELTAANLRIFDAGLGAFVQNSSLFLKDSNVVRTQQTSILGGTESILRIETSTFEDSPGGFVAASLNSTSVALVGNTFRRAIADNCITVSAGSLAAEDNVIDTCAGSGISALGVDVRIHDNRIENIQLDRIVGIVATAVSVTDATGTIERNTIKDTMDNGISVIDSVVTTDSNTIGPVNGSGISYVDGPSAKSRFLNNVISEATGAGIIVLNASVDVEGNTIADTKLSSGTSFGDGIVFGSAANVDVVDNSVTGSARSGILFFDGATGEIRDNNSFSNGQYGISELCIGTGNQVVVGENTLTNNTAGESQLCSM